MIYILKIEPPLHHARYYVGWADDKRLAARIEAHQDGKGCHLTKAAVASGRKVRMVISFPGDRNLERWIKNRKNTPRFVQTALKHGSTFACRSYQP